MARKTLYDKLWDALSVRTDPHGMALVCIDRHPLHEMTFPQAFRGPATGQASAVAAGIHGRHA